LDWPSGTVDKDTALGNVISALKSLEKRQSGVNLKAAFSGSSVAFIGISEGITENVKLKNLNVTSYGTDGTTNSLCIWSPVIAALFYRPHCNEAGTWAISSSDPDTAVMTGAWMEINNITVSFFTPKSGVFSLTGSNVEAIPGGITGNGVYTVMKNDFSASRIAGKTITLAGFPECSDGVISFSISDDGSKFSKSCKTSIAPGLRLTCPTAGTIEDSKMIGIVKFVGGACHASSTHYYFGITNESDISSGTAVIANSGSPNCGAASTAACGFLGLYKYTSK
jgi:hypothetical protein